MEDMLEHSVRLMRFRKTPPRPMRRSLANMDEIACEWMKKNEASWKLWLPRRLAGYNQAAWQQPQHPPSPTQRLKQLFAVAAAVAASARLSPSPPPWPPLATSTRLTDTTSTRAAVDACPAPLVRPRAGHGMTMRVVPAWHGPRGPARASALSAARLPTTFTRQDGATTVAVPAVTSRHPSSRISREECQCRGGAYAVDPPTPPRVECPEGAFCKGADSAPAILDGFWGFKDSSRQSGRFWECSPKSLCVEV